MVAEGARGCKLLGFSSLAAEVGREVVSPSGFRLGCRRSSKGCEPIGLPWLPKEREVVSFWGFPPVGNEVWRSITLISRDHCFEKCALDKQ